MELAVLWFCDGGYSSFHVYGLGNELVDRAIQDRQLAELREVDVMPTAPPSLECIHEPRPKAPAWPAARPTKTPSVCPPGCPSAKAAQADRPQFYRDIHAAAPPRGCLDCIRKEVTHSEYRAPRPCPPGTKPIPERPLGAWADEAFLNTFDCQEQPWRRSKHRAESHHEFGCQNIWRPTVRAAKLTGDSLGDLAQPQPEPTRRSSKTYMPCARDYGKSFSWRPCIRSAGENLKQGCENSWRPCVHVAEPREGGAEKPHVNCIRVPTAYSSTWKETSSPPFRPSLRYIPAFNPERRDWRIAKGHVCSRQCVHQLQDSAYIHGHHSSDDAAADTIPEIHTAKKLTPFKEHPCNLPSYCLPVDDPASSPRPDDGHLKEEIVFHRGKKSIPSPPDSGACTPRLAHSGCSFPASAQSPQCSAPDQRRGKRLITPDDIGDRDVPCRKGRVDGDKFPSAVCGQREYVIFEPLVRELNLQPLLHVQRGERQPFAPQGRLNEYVIDGHFHGFQKPRELLTEQRAQFTTSKPWLRKQIFDDMSKASRENKCQCWSVSSSLTGYLYEDRNAVVR